MAILKLTFKDGAPQEFPFETTSTVTVSTETYTDGQAGLKTLTWSDITGLEVVTEPGENEKPPPPPKPDAALLGNR